MTCALGGHAPAAASELTLDWRVADRLADRDGDGIVDGTVTPDSVASDRALLRVQVRGAAECSGEVNWELDGRDTSATRVGRCAFELPARRSGQQELVARVNGEELRERVALHDHLVVSIGDSVASGEGNPDTASPVRPRWLERRCHRSMRSGAAHSAVALERASRQSSITFVPLACSGATVPVGLLGSYAGAQPDRRLGRLPAQVGEARALAARRRIDALLLSVGANDVRFSALTIFCAVLDECSRRRFNPDFPYREARRADAPTASEFVREALVELRARYRTLAAAFRRFVAAERVIAVEYFDPFSDVTGDVCAAPLPGIDADEAAWAQREVLGPLNAELRKAAADHGWRTVAGVAEAFRGHGICAAGIAAWVRRFEGSLRRQGALSGTLHPNERGHLATAALIAPVLAATLGDDAAAGLTELAGESDTEHGGVPWGWIPLAAFFGAALLPTIRRLRSLAPRLPVVARTLAGTVARTLRTAFAAIAGIGLTAGALAAVGLLWEWWPAIAVLIAAAAYLLGRELGSPWPAVIVLAAIAAAGLSFFTDSSALLWIEGIGALVGGLAYFVSQRGVSEADPSDSDGRRRAGWLLVRVALSLLAFAAVFVGAAVIVGEVLARRAEPIEERWLDAGVGVFALALLLLFAWLVWSAFRLWPSAHPGFALEISIGRRASKLPLPRATTSFILAGFLVVLVLAALDVRDVPREEARDSEQARQAGRGRYDLLLVIDPADAISRRLIQVAREDLAAGRGGRLFQAVAGGIFDAGADGMFAGTERGRYDVAFGLAVPQRPRRGRQLWRLVEPPTDDYRELSESLVGIRAQSGRLAAGSYGRVLADTLISQKIRWRGGSQHGVAFVLRRLPRLAELNAVVPRQRQRVAAWTGPTAACQALTGARETSTLPQSSRVPVAWEEALANHCARRAEQRRWEDAGRPRDDPVRPPVALHVVTGEPRRTRAALWRTWAHALDGGFERARLGAVDHADAEWAAQTSSDLHLGKPVGELADLADYFRPHLRFDEGEKFFPIDADWFLANPANNGKHRVCDHRRGENSCQDIRDGADLVGPLDEYIDFGGGIRRGGRQSSAKEGPPARMYVHTRKAGGRLYLDYWWFFPYNSSPWRSRVNCLPGFTFADLSCFDHEGDWEGVTVVLRVLKRRVLPQPYYLANVAPEAVIYAAHKGGLRWEWEDVELAADDDRHYATHPVVYVANGSHASYPAGCLADECGQSLGKSPWGEGGFDGEREWLFNRSASCSEDQIARDGRALGGCLLALPSTRDGRLGVLWNAFPGRWGAAVCSEVGKACSQTDGPRSPSYQGRYRNPGAARAGDRRTLKRFQREYRLERRRRAQRRLGRPLPPPPRRWPPSPVPRGGSLPTSPILPK